MTHSHLRPLLTREVLRANMQARMLRLAALSTAPVRQTRPRWDNGQYIMERVSIGPRS